MSQTRHNQTARREFLKSGCAAIAGAGCLSRGLTVTAGQSGHAGPQDKLNVHNMLIVGQQTVFLSHLPMFSEPTAASPRRYQAILEVTYTKSDSSNPQAVYASDRKNNPQTKIYTLNPQEFVLPNLITTSTTPLSRFQAKVFQGHLEKPGHKPLLSDVEVNVTKVVHFREFDPNAAALAQLEYILFGKGKELFLAHFITKPPDFDQVLQVSIADRTLPAEALSKGLRVLFSRPNSVAKRLREKEEAMGEIRGLGGAASAMKVRVKAEVEFYFEEGELRVPAEITETTAAEKEAGFPQQ